jgi:hypothetical protein
VRVVDLSAYYKIEASRLPVLMVRNIGLSWLAVVNQSTNLNIKIFAVGDHNRGLILWLPEITFFTYH